MITYYAWTLLAIVLVTVEVLFLGAFTAAPVLFAVAVLIFSGLSRRLGIFLTALASLLLGILSLQPWPVYLFIGAGMYLLVIWLQRQGLDPGRFVSLALMMLVLVSWQLAVLLVLALPYGFSRAGLFFLLAVLVQQTLYSSLVAFWAVRVFKVQ